MPVKSKFEFSKEDKLILAIDESGSMAENDGNETTRWQDAFKDVETYVKVAGGWNPSGITLIIFGNGVEEYRGIKTVGQLDQILNKHHPRGHTNTHLAIQRAWKEHTDDGHTTTFMVIMTDGHASEPEALESTLTEIGLKLGESKEFEIAFVTLGGDSAELHAEMTDVINTMSTRGTPCHYISVHDSDDIKLDDVLDEALTA